MEDASTTHLMPSTHSWINELKKYGQPIPRACEIDNFSMSMVELDKVSYSNVTTEQRATSMLKQNCEKKLCASNFHNHTFTYEKGVRGNFFVDFVWHVV